MYLLKKQKMQNKFEFFTSDSIPYGKTYGQWTVEWWRWALSIPKSMNPVVDTSGKYANVNQPDTDVWFLAGKFGAEDKEFPHRQCIIPVGKSILFPVVNCEANSLEYPELKTEQDIIDYVSKDEDTIVKTDCFINGERLPIERVRSDPPTFSLTISKDNAIGVKGGGSTIAAADGYWVFLKPIPKGEYSLSFGGSCENGRLNSGAIYKLKVQ
jgi:hypothetical protein